MFHLVRYFSIASLVSMVVAALILGLMYRYIAQNNLMVLGENQNAALAKVFSNTLWPYYADFISELENLDAEQIRQHSITDQLMYDIVNDAVGVSVVKVKIYTKRGLTVFSTSASQIGEDKSKHLEFLMALRGERATELEFREAMPGLDGTIKNRDIIASYIPIINSETGAVDGVFELYSDVTSLFSYIKRTEYTVYGGVSLMFVLLYLILFTIIKRADVIIKEHQLDLKNSQKKATHQAMHDALTGLPNRFLLKNRLDQAMRAAQCNETLMAVLFIDLDRFKPINDSLGHAVGDALLKQVAKRLLASVRECDTVARIGGDEFVIGLEKIIQVDEANEIAKRILDSLAKPIVVKGHSLYITSSIGITFYPFEEDQISVDELIKNADAAMYAVKKSGRNTYQIFSHDMRFDMDNGVLIEQRLHPALKNNEFELYFQPIVDLKSAQVMSLEGLIRWNSPEQGVIPPEDFMPALEDSGLIVDVGQWVIEEVCRALNVLARQGCGSLRININISPKQFFHVAFIASVERTLRQFHIDRDQLGFEITESVLLDNSEHVTETMEQIRNMGISVCIDDFGVGYSSLSCLKRMPVQTIKINRGFVREMTTNADDVAIFKAIVALSKSLGLTTVADGIETEEQYRVILREKVDFMQGSHLCKSMSLPDLMHQFAINKAGIWLLNRLDNSANH